LIVPPSLYKVADELLNTKELYEFGNYCKLQLRNEKPYWARKKCFISDGRKIELNDLIRMPYDEYCEDAEKSSLPRAMRKRGYIVKHEYIGMGEYNKWIEKRSYNGGGRSKISPQRRFKDEET